MFVGVWVVLPPTPYVSTPRCIGRFTETASPLRPEPTAASPMKCFFQISPTTPSFQTLPHFKIYLLQFSLISFGRKIATCS